MRYAPALLTALTLLGGGAPATLAGQLLTPSGVGARLVVVPGAPAPGSAAHLGGGAGTRPAPPRRPYSGGERAILAVIGWRAGGLAGAWVDREPRCVVGDSSGRCPGDVPVGYLVGGALGIALGVAAGPHATCSPGRRRRTAALWAGAGATLAALNLARPDPPVRAVGLIFPVGAVAGAVVAVQRCRA